MNRKLALLLIGFIIPSFIYAISTNADALQATLPPTKAWYNIFTDNQNIQANNYAGNLTVRAGNYIDIDANPTNDTITISAVIPAGSDTNTAQLNNTGTNSIIKNRYNATHWNLYGLKAGSNIGVSLVGNDLEISSTASGGNATNLNDLGDVSLSGVAYGHILQFVNGYWQNKLFKSNTISCTGTDKISSYDNQTGSYSCTADQGLTTAITSLNGDTTAAQTISGTSRNITITDTGAGTLQVNTGDKIVTSDGSQTLLNKIISGASNTLSNIAQASVTNLVSDLASKENTANKAIANGYAPLNSNKLLPNANLATNTNSSATDCLKGDRTWGSCGGTDTNTAQIFNAGGTSLIKQRLNATAHDLKGVTTTQGITVTANTNDVQINTNFKIDNLAATNKIWPTGFTNSSGDWSTRTFALNNQTVSKDFQIVGINNQTGVVTRNQFSVNTQSCTAGQMIQSIDNATGSVVCATVTASGGATSLAANVTGTASVSSDTLIWTIPLTANSGNTISGVITATTSTSGNAVRGAANVTSQQSRGYCYWRQVSTTSAQAVDNLVLNTVLTGRATNTGETAWIGAANVAMPIKFDCSIVSGATPGNLKIWTTPEVATAYQVKAGSYYIKTP